MIHVVFQQNDIDVLQEAIALDKTLEGPVIQIADDFAVGPVSNMYSGEGIAWRKQWWRDDQCRMMTLQWPHSSPP